MTNISVSQMITTCIVLPVNTLEGNWVEEERQHSLSNTYFSTHLGERASSGQPAHFLYSLEFLNKKCEKFSS